MRERYNSRSGAAAQRLRQSFIFNAVMQLNPQLKNIRCAAAPLRETFNSRIEN
jgi:hypothetical protein